MPLVGGYIADTYLGRYMTIQISIIAAILGHIVLICSSIPSVMDNPSGALGCLCRRFNHYGTRDRRFQEQCLTITRRAD